MRRWCRVGAMATAVGFPALLFALPSAPPASAATTPTITDQGATTVYYDGAAVTGTLSDAGDTDFLLVGLSYGPVGGTQSPPSWVLPTTTGASVPVAATLAQLSANTTYSYTWEIADNTAGTMTPGPSGTFTTAALPSGAARPLVPAANPASNGIYPSCAADADCLADINGVRAAQENLSPIVLPTNWASLTGAEQIFVFANLERVSRGINPIADLVNTYDSYEQTGVANDTDPIPPIGAGGIWAGAWATPIAAFDGWEYYDGPGGSNLDCTATSTAGCWGHRDNVLLPGWDEMDAYTGMDNNGQVGYDASFWNDNGVAPAAANVVMTWASEQQYLATGGNAPPVTTAATTPMQQPPTTPSVCNGCAPPLVNAGGQLVGTGATPGAVTVTPIYWYPAGSTPPSPNYGAEVQKYLTDVAANPASSVLSVLNEYSATPLTIAAGAALTDTDPYPAGGCTPDPGFSSCITYSQVTAELNAYSAANHLHQGLDQLYTIMFPAGAELQGFSGKNSASAFCGYHGYVVGGGAYQAFTAEPAPTMNQCNTGQSPNGDPIADSEISILTAEIADAVTDPTTMGWTDANGWEIGDECASVYGAPQGSTNAAKASTTEYNQTVNGDHFYVQELYSNKVGAAGPNQGCVQAEPGAAAGTTAALSRSAPGLSHHYGRSGDEVTVTVGEPALAQGQSTALVVHVSTASATPVAHDHVVVNLTNSTDENSGTCGRVSATGGYTNRAGNLTLRYTASGASAACIVSAVEGATGQDGSTTLYLGHLEHVCPHVTYAGAHRVALRHRVAISASVINPADAIGDAMTDVHITGLDSRHRGLVASQISLRYRLGRRGRWITVPLRGHTADGGAVSSSLEAGPGIVAARSRTRYEFRLEIRGSLSRDVSRSLRFSVSVVQLDAADGCATTMYADALVLHLR